MPYRTCKRCSVTRVNILCDLYSRAYEEKEEKALRDFIRLVKLAAERGYRDGLDLQKEGLDEQRVRSVCWNVSSVLTDEDLIRLGYPAGGK